MYTRLSGNGRYPRRFNCVIPRAFDAGVDHTTLSTPGVLCPRFSVTRRTASALPQNERVRNRCKAFTLRQVLFLRCLGDSYLQVSNIPVHPGPVDAVPFDQVCRRRRCRSFDKTLPVVELHSHLLSPLVIPSKKTQVSPCGDIAFPAGKIHRNFYRQIARRDHVEVSPLSREATFKPLSGPLQPGVRFLHNPLPALPTASLTIGLPAREQPTRAEIRAYLVPCQQQEQLRSCLSTGGALSTCLTSERDNRPLTILVRAYSVAFARL